MRGGGGGGGAGEACMAASAWLWCVVLVAVVSTYIRTSGSSESGGIEICGGKNRSH